MNKHVNLLYLKIAHVGEFLIGNEEYNEEVLKSSLKDESTISIRMDRHV